VHYYEFQFLDGAIKSVRIIIQCIIKFNVSIP